MFRGHVELVVFGVLQHQILFVFVALAHSGGARESGHAVVDVHHVAAGNQVRQGRDLVARLGGLAPAVAALFDGAKQFGIGQQNKGSGAIRLTVASVGIQSPAFPKSPLHQVDSSPLRSLVYAGSYRRGDPFLLQYFSQTASMLGNRYYCLALGGVPLGIIGQLLQPAVVRDCRLKQRVLGFA